MYKITSEQLKWAFESPACRHVYVAGDSYCAVGKFCSALLGQDVFKANLEVRGMDMALKGPPLELLKAMRDKGLKWINYSDINDSDEGSLEDNHRKALRALFQDCLAAGILELEDDVAKDLYAEISMREANPCRSIGV